MLTLAEIILKWFYFTCNHCITSVPKLCEHDTLHLEEFRQIFNFDVLEDKYEWLDSEVKRTEFQTEYAVKVTYAMMAPHEVLSTVIHTTLFCCYSSAVCHLTLYAKCQSFCRVCDWEHSVIWVHGRIIPTGSSYSAIRYDKTVLTL